MRVARKASEPMRRASNRPVEDDPSAPTYRASGRLCRLDRPRHPKTNSHMGKDRGRAAGSLVVGGFAVFGCGADVDQRTARVPRIRATLEQRLCRTCAIVLAIVVGLVAIVALWLFGAWLASEVLLH